MLLQLNTTLAYLSYLHWGHKTHECKKNRVQSTQSLIVHAHADLS
jgi:hypothetical protein